MYWLREAEDNELFTGGNEMFPYDGRLAALIPHIAVIEEKIDETTGGISFLIIPKDNQMARITLEFYETEDEYMEDEKDYGTFNKFMKSITSDQEARTKSKDGNVILDALNPIMNDTDIEGKHPKVLIIEEMIGLYNELQR
jgi:hypothetical protein